MKLYINMGNGLVILLFLLLFRRFLMKIKKYRNTLIEVQEKIKKIPLV